jgi:uncharacterized protein (DUF2141 family)
MKYLILFCLIFTGNIVYGQTHSLTITIPNLKNTQGKVVIGVFNKKEDFPKDDKQLKLLKFNADKFPGTCTINGLPKGEYAIAVFHDKNADGNCNTNFMGIPKEGYGFSNNIKPLFSAPTFNECKIDLNTNMAITIKLIY